MTSIAERAKELDAKAQQAAEQRAEEEAAGGQHHSDTDFANKFRGTWNYVVTDRPAFNAYSFLPTPPAVKPRGEATAAIEVTAEAELRYEPPDDAEVLLVIKDRYSEYRGYISDQGECVNNRDQTIGFINSEDGTAGSAEEEYLGSIVDQICGNQCVVEDALDERCGMMDLGHATIQDNQGSTIAEISATGKVTGNQGSQLGDFEGFTFTHLRVVSLYLMLVDPGMLNEVEG
eukprot:CAMPEP_0118974352 /NCGR_PEP_ID=MMETSP1173-20130426/11203_1 /TAXON_ID=1034831 /ORGANISM="Rhizochromulina marina cf, Strain CCMP1243" /LENGTH=231 /DNA_ID=CAMNT_0006924071 /DNA_START=27 /DNA_END=722 /DNA_ORIENTATION=-